MLKRCKEEQGEESWKENKVRDIGDGGWDSRSSRAGQWKCENYRGIILELDCDDDTEGTKLNKKMKYDNNINYINLITGKIQIIPLFLP